MKATVSHANKIGTSLWEGEVLEVDWDNNKGEITIRGNRDSAAISEVISSMVEKRELTIEIEGTGPGLLVWRGHVGSAKFQVSESEHVECCLSMQLDDWFGIFPESAIPSPLDVQTRTRLYPPLLPP